jgi:hypothetical protein
MMARLEYYREQIYMSFNTQAPGLVGATNREFREISARCLDQMPVDRYSVHADHKLELALQLIEQAKDAIVKAVIIAKEAPLATDSTKD